MHAATIESAACNFRKLPLWDVILSDVYFTELRTHSTNGSKFHFYTQCECISCTGTYVSRARWPLARPIPSGKPRLTRPTIISSYMQR